MSKHKGKKLIVVMSGGPISELGHITGPILHPWYVETDTVLRMVSNNRRVFEVNPDKRDERVLLTLKNIRLNNFGKAEVKKDFKSPEKGISNVTPANTIKEPAKEDIVKPEAVNTSDFTKKK